MNASWIGVRCSRREPAVQDWPAYRKPERDRVEGLVQVRIGEHEDRRLAAAFDGHPLKLRDQLHEAAADLAAPGERDLVDARIGGEGLTDDLALADDTIRDAGWQPGIRSSSSKIAVDDAGASLGRLEDERAAGRDRRTDLAEWQVDRVVPRR